MKITAIRLRYSFAPRVKPQYSTPLRKSNKIKKGENYAIKKR